MSIKPVSGLKVESRTSRIQGTRPNDWTGNLNGRGAKVEGWRREGS